MIRLSSLFLLFTLISCDSDSENHLFVQRSADSTHINFANTITESDVINVLDFQYCYNGGGVGIADFNNDQLPDLVFTGNQVSSKIYLNEGELVFTDISEKANFFTQSWVTGVSIVDINTDGWDDIYLNVGGSDCNNDCPNLLFVHQGLDENGIPEFKEMAKDYGLDDANYAQQAVFFDYDLDGDLDVYIAHNGNVKFDKNTPMPKRYYPDHLSDYVLRNDTIEGKNHPVFTNVSDSININQKGFGLGVGINDFNDDNRPDVYVSNDFITDDLMYINTVSSDGKTPNFIESSKEYLSHETYNAMGVDIADINNDAIPDILVLDMLPKQYKRQKLMLGSMNYDKYLLSQQNDYATQYMHNTLQLGNGFIGDQPIKASEVAFQKGISSTDWSWAPLMVDFDNDGLKDIYITNGYVKDITDLDFINYSNENRLFGTPEAKTKRLKESIAKMPGIYLTNFFYKQTADENFEDFSNIWTSENASFSNGAAYTDLDLDGDLDLVVNNINDKAFVLENRTSLKNNNNYLRIKLLGGKKNAKAIGAKISVYTSGEVQTHYQSVIRGYLSSVEPVVHFGLAQDTLIDSLKVVWPNEKITTKYKVKTNQLLNLSQSDAFDKKNSKLLHKTTFSEADDVVNFTQNDKFINEYTSQSLLSRQFTSKSTCIAAANIDGIVGDELFVGGAAGTASSIWFQNQSGNYEPKQYLDANYDDTQAVFVDLDADEDLDLVVASGGNRFDNDSELYQNRIYLNNGKGHFEKNRSMLPSVLQSTKSIAAADFDKDGDIDLFAGSRIIPKNYPLQPNSTFLINNSGTFEPAFEALFSKLGMVNHAVWADIDNDDWKDLIVVGEFMQITSFKNNKGRLEPLSLNWVDENNQTINTSGWWNHIVPADFDNDGDLDFIIANQGTNGFMKPTQDKPIYVYQKDYDENGSVDPVLAKYFETEKGTELLPVQTRDDIMKQLPSLKNKYTTYESFAVTDFDKLLQIEDWSQETLKATTFESCYAENLGNGTFKLIPLPKECQVAPINAVLLDDFNEDGLLDFLAVGNDFTAETNYGRHDALNGLMVLQKDGFFEAVPTSNSGFYVPGQSNHLIDFTDAKGQTYIMATQLNDEAQVFLKKQN